MPDEELNRDIPVLVRKYIPGINRGLSWAKYSKEKSEGTNMKSEAFSEARKEGLAAALSISEVQDREIVLEKKLNPLWSQAKKLMEEAKEISSTVNTQPSKDAREIAMNKAKRAARKAGLQAAIAAGWEQGWKEGILKQDSK